jgi:hypothetical protein
MLTAEISTRLTAQGLVTGDYEVFRGKVPASPDEVIVLHETGGAGAEQFLGATASLEQPALKITVRGTRFQHDEPRLIIERIYRKRDALSELDTASVTVPVAYR